MNRSLVILAGACLIILAWIAHEDNTLCGGDDACKIAMEAPQ